MLRIVPLEQIQIYFSMFENQWPHAISVNTFIQ